MRLRQAAAIVMGIVGALGLTGAAPVVATAPGSMTATGIVHLSDYPGQALSQAANFCNNGLVDGSVEADGVMNPLTGACTSGSPSLTVTYGYMEPCPTDGVVGYSAGEIHRLGATGPIVQDFLWNRYGLTAIILLSGTTYGGSGTTGHPIGPEDLAHTDGVAVATFTPLATPSIACPGEPLKAYIAAVGSW